MVLLSPYPSDVYSPKQAPHTSTSEQIPFVIECFSLVVFWFSMLHLFMTSVVLLSKDKKKSIKFYTPRRDPTSPFHPRWLLAFSSPPDRAMECCLIFRSRFRNVMLPFSLKQFFFQFIDWVSKFLILFRCGCVHFWLILEAWVSLVRCGRPAMWNRRFY